MIFEEEKNGFLISTDKAKLDVPVIYRYLSEESYWAKNIPLETVKKCIEGSVCFGIYHSGKQAGFARVITDFATFGYIADVFIIDAYRGKGLSKWMMQCIMTQPEFQNFRKWMLATKDAHGLYHQFGFRPLEKPERVMGYSTFTEYPVQQKKTNS